MRYSNVNQPTARHCAAASLTNAIQSNWAVAIHRKTKHCVDMYGADQHNTYTRGVVQVCGTATPHNARCWSKRDAPQAPGRCQRDNAQRNATRGCRETRSQSKRWWLYKGYATQLIEKRANNRCVPTYVARVVNAPKRTALQ